MIRESIKLGFFGAIALIVGQIVHMLVRLAAAAIFGTILLVCVVAFFYWAFATGIFVIPN